MEGKTIKANMTNGTWVTDTIESEGEIHITHFSGTVSLATCYAEPLDDETKANAAAIVSAVNNTWGKGINPESVFDLLECLRDSLSDLSEHMNEGQRAHFQKVLQSATL